MQESEGSTDRNQLHKPVRTAAHAEEPKKKTSEFPYQGVPSLKPVVEVPPLPIKYNKTPIETKDTRNNPSYRHKEEIQAGVDIDDVLSKAINQGVLLPLKEILVVAPQLRDKFIEVLHKKHVPVAEIKLMLQDDSLELEEQLSEAPVYVAINLLEAPAKVCNECLDPMGQYLQTWQVNDAILQYLEKLSPAERKHQVFTISSEEVNAARDMAAFRVIPALINKVHEEEALLDSGSQIVSMSREAVSTGKITWDPELTINMQSVNGQITKTCGLAKNVAFNFENVTIHLQVHVMEQAPYRVLLGRPFDMITESKIANSTEGHQFIHITDPNTGEHTSLSTYP
ncbi:hypothetical protein AN958_02640 [Leucoagaricus sp. SymC.cos]|nr:hypothetical protein AN958_02640 [Leucoagaricus sp. SymC.cos]